MKLYSRQIIRCLYTYSKMTSRKNASSKSKREYFLDDSEKSYEFYFIITSYQSSVSHENKITEIIFEAEKTTSVRDRGHQFRVTQDFSYCCFVS